MYLNEEESAALAEEEQQLTNVLRLTQCVLRRVPPEHLPQPEAALCFKAIERILHSREERAMREARVDYSRKASGGSHPS
jgi:hypothetical protein